MSLIGKEKSALRREVFKYVLPSVLSMWVFTIYTMVDGMFVARGVGPDALAGVNIAMPFININFGLALMLAIGASTVGAMYMGQKDKENACMAFTMNAFAVAAVAVVMTAFALIFTDTLAVFLGADAQTIGYVIDYIRIIALFNPCFMVSYYFEVMVKTDGHPNKSIVAVVSGAVCNIVLDYIFVIRFGWGVKGAAWATGISQLLTMCLFLHHFTFKPTNFRFTRFKFNIKKLGRTIKIGMAESVTEFSVGIVTLLFNRQLLAVSGVDAVAVYTVIAYTASLVTMTMVGINQGILPRMSFYLGSGQREKCGYVLKTGMIIAGVVSLAAWALCTLVPQPIAGAFFERVGEAELFNHATKAMGLYSIAFLFMGMNVVISGFFTAMEQPRQALLITLSRGLLLVTGSLFAMSALFGETGIWLSVGVSELLTLCISFVLFFRFKDKILDKKC